MRFSEQRLVHARERRPQIGVLADHDRRAGVERERRRLRDHEVERVRARGERALGRGGELQPVMVLGVQRDDAERTREGIGETGREAVGDLRAERGAAEDAAEIAALARPRALAFGGAAAAQEDQPDQEEHDRRRRGDECELEEEPAAGICEEDGTRLVDHDRPAGDRGHRVGDGVMIGSVEPGRVRDDPRATQGSDQRQVRRIAGAVEQRAAVAVENRDAGPAEVECALRDRERPVQQGGREDARHAPARIHRGHGHDDHARAVHAAVDALAHIRPSVSG